MEWDRERKSCKIVKKNVKIIVVKLISPPIFLYSLDVVRATDLEIANTVEIAIVQILDEKCKF